MRYYTRRSNRCRRGVAAVEFAFVVPLLLLLLVGIWELGRIIHVQIIMNNAARDGARLAAQANIVNTTGAYTQVHFDTGTPNVDQTIRNYLHSAGIHDHTGLVIELQFTESPVAGGPVPTAMDADPYIGIKNQRFRVKVSIPYDNVRWTSLTLINPSVLTAEVYWQCLVDDPFTVNTTLPGWSP
jgi:hypothetical protein